MSPMEILTEMPEQRESQHGVCDRSGTVHIPKKKSHYVLAPRVRALHEQLCRMVPCTVRR